VHIWYFYLQEQTLSKIPDIMKLRSAAETAEFILQKVTQKNVLNSAIVQRHHTKFSGNGGHCNIDSSKTSTAFC